MKLSLLVLAIGLFTSISQARITSPSPSSAPAPAPKYSGVCRSGVQTYPKNHDLRNSITKSCETVEMNTCLMQALDSCVRGFTQGQIKEPSGALYPPFCSGSAYYPSSVWPQDLRACCTIQWTCEEMLPGTYPDAWITPAPQPRQTLK